MGATKILIVDDVEGIQVILSEIIQTLGYIPIVANNGVEAYDLVTKDGIDLIITDLVMPEMGGMELLRKVKEFDPIIPVAIITAYGSPETAVEALKSGAYNFISKPFKVREIENIVRKGLYLRSLSQETRQVASYAKITVDLEIPNRKELIHGVISMINDQATKLGFSREATTVDIPLSLDEALINAIVHGNQNNENKKLFIKAMINAQKMEVRVRDEGEGFDLSKLPDPQTIEELPLETGRGLFLIKCFMDEISFNKKGNEIRLVKYNNFSNR